jgi:hypothetical protein
VLIEKVRPSATGEFAFAVDQHQARRDAVKVRFVRNYPCGVVTGNCGLVDQKQVSDADRDDVAEVNLLSYLVGPSLTPSVPCRRSVVAMQTEQMQAQELRETKAAIEYARAASLRPTGPKLTDPDLVIRAAVRGIGVGTALEAQLKRLISQGRLIQVLQDWCPTFSRILLLLLSESSEPSSSVGCAYRFTPALIVSPIR